MEGKVAHFFVLVAPRRRQFRPRLGKSADRHRLLLLYEIEKLWGYEFSFQKKQRGRRLKRDVARRRGGRMSGSSSGLEARGQGMDSAAAMRAASRADADAMGAQTLESGLPRQSARERAGAGARGRASSAARVRVRAVLFSRLDKGRCACVRTAPLRDAFGPVSDLRSFRKRTFLPTGRAVKNAAWPHRDALRKRRRHLGSGARSSREKTGRACLAMRRGPGGGSSRERGPSPRGLVTRKKEASRLFGSCVSRGPLGTSASRGPRAPAAPVRCLRISLRRFVDRKS